MQMLAAYVNPTDAPRSANMTLRYRHKIELTERIGTLPRLADRSDVQLIAISVWHKRSRDHYCCSWPAWAELQFVELV